MGCCIAGGGAMLSGLEGLVWAGSVGHQPRSAPSLRPLGLPWPGGVLPMLPIQLLPCSPPNLGVPAVANPAR